MLLPSREEIQLAVRPALATTVIVVAVVVVLALLIQRLGAFVVPALAVLVPGVWVYQLWQVRSAQSL